MGEWRQPVNQPTCKGYIQNASSSILLMRSDHLETQLPQASDVQQAATSKSMLTQEIVLLLNSVPSHTFCCSVLYIDCCSSLMLY